MNNKGIFYVLTATEIQMLQRVIRDYANTDEGNGDEEVHFSLELLSKVQPVDTEQALTAMEAIVSDEDELEEV